MENNTLRIEDLRFVVERIFDFIVNDLGVRDVPLDKNFYWYVSEEDLHLMEKTPAQLDVGSLLDDWQFIKSAKENPEQALPLLMLHVAPILRALAIKLPNFKA